MEKHKGKSGGIELGLVVSILLAMLGIFWTNGELSRIDSVKQTRLTLAALGCVFFDSQMKTKHEIRDGACTVETLFRPNMASTGGAVFDGPESKEPAFHLSESQIVAVQRLRDRPPSELRQRALVRVLISITMMLIFFFTFMWWMR